MDRPIEEEWRNFELYEKVRIRENRKRFFFVSLATILFLSLCSVPVFEERLPKWRSMRAAQEISVEAEKLKTIAIREKKPVRLRFLVNGAFQFEVLSQCDSTKVLKVVREGHWQDAEGTLKVMSMTEAQDQLQPLKLAIDTLCFDPVFGLDGIKSKKVLVIVPVKDLSDKRLDRASDVVFEGESAKISIN